MKKIWKLLALVISLVLIVSAVVLIASAEEEITAPFIIDGVAYGDETTTFADAIYYACRNGKQTVKLNADVTVTAGIGISANLTIDLNGHTVTDTRTNVNNVVFGASKDKSDITITIKGEGKFANIPRHFFKTTNETADNITININGEGKGITFDSGYTANTSSIFYLPAEKNYEVNISGNVNVVPATMKYAFYFVEFGGATANDKLSVNIDDANITVEPSKDAEDYRWVNKQAAYFAYLNDGAKINIDDSVIDMKHGNGFWFNGGSDIAVVSSGGQVTSRGDSVAKPTHNQFVTINNSTIAARCSDYSSMYAYRGAGVLFNLLVSSAEVKISNTDLIGSARSMVTKEYSTDGGTKAVKSKLYFTNVNYSINDEYVVDPYPYPLMNRLNIQWNGGKIDLTSWSSKSAYQIKGMSASLTNPFCDEVKAYVIAQSGATDEVAKEAAWKDFVDKYTDNDASDGSIYVANGTAEKEGGVATGKYTYTFYLMQRGKAIASLGSRNYKFNELADGDWYGIKFSDVYFTKAILDSKNDPVSTGYTYAYTGTKYTNVYAPGDGTLYEMAFLSGTPLYESTKPYDPYTTVYNPTSEWYGYPDGRDVPNSTIPMNPNSIAFSNNDYGTGHLVIGKNGTNGYFKYEIGAEEVDTATGNPYIETKLGNAYAVAAGDYTVKLNGAGNDLEIAIGKNNQYSLNQYKYVVHEFDVATDDEFMGFDQIFLVARAATLKATASAGSYVYAINTTTASAHATVNLGITAKTGVLKDTKASSKTSAMPSLATDGSWSRFTIVFEVGEWVKDSTSTLGNLTRDLGHLDVKMHVYLNGEWVSTYNQVIKSNVVDKALVDSVIIDAIRFQPLCNAEGETASILFDNIRTSYYKDITVGYSDVASAMENPKKSLVGNAEFMTMPKNPIGTVNGTPYYTEASLTAAMTDGCQVELHCNLRNPLTASCAFTLDTNGYNVPGVYSETHKITRTENTITAVAASANEIIKVNFVSPDFDINTSVYAAIGSDVNVPESVKPESNPTVFKTESGIVNYLNIAGWTVDDDGRADALLTIREDITYINNEFNPIPLVSRGVAASYVFLDTLGNPATDKIYAVPGDNTYPILPENFELTDYVDESGWFEVNFVSWETVKATAITEARHYELMPDVETKIPNSGIAGLKLNLSLYTDYELNIYIPKIESETISNVKFTSDAEFNVSVESRGDVTIYGDLYTQYFDRYGTADVSINSYYLSFEANGQTLVQEIKYGIPSYAATVMSKTDSAIGVTAKKLVMNMVNYAVKVLELSSADMSSGGAYYYKRLLDMYGGENYSYLDAYNKLDRSDFTDTESTVYKEQIANLTYKSALGTYIKNASFLFTTDTPVFVFEYSDAAKSAEGGIGAPKNLFCDPTAGGIYVLFGYGNEAKNPVRHLAYNGGIVSGTDVTATDVWGANTNAAISYYAYGDSYRYVDANSGGYHSAYNLLSPVTVDVMKGDGVLASGTYSLAAYINSLMTSGDDSYVDAACALYSYALAADDFRRNGSGVLPDEEIYTKKQSVLLIGQSNMVGSNDLSVVAPIEDDRITMLRDDVWVKMQEPIHGHTSSNAGAGIGASFAKAFVETFDCELGLIPAAVGGTNLNTSGNNTNPDTIWAVGSKLYNEAIRLAKIAQQDSEICAILWHQGEGDQNGTTYAEKLQPIFDGIIAELGLDPDKIIIVTGELYGTRSDLVHRPELEDLSKHYKHFGIAESDGLTTVDPQTHFDAPSMRVFGYRYFDIFYNFVTGKHYDFVDDPLHYLLEAEDTVSGNVLSDINFNSYTTGAATNISGVIKYATATTGSITVVEELANEKYLKLETALKSDSTTDYCTPFFDVYCTVPAGSVIVLEAKIKLDNPTDIASFDLFKIIENRENQNLGVYSALQIRSDGMIYNVVGNKTSEGTCLNYALDPTALEWTPVKVVIDIAANTKDIYLNNQLVVEGAQFINKVHTDFAPTYVRVIHFNSATNKGAICIDDYKLSLIPSES